MGDSVDFHKNTLVLTVGLPRSGKSTWALTKGYPIVCPDAIRMAMHGSAFNPETERMVWAIAHYMVKALFYSGHHIVILDATNTTRERRAEWKSLRWKRRYMLFQVSKEECLARAADRPDLWPIIERMATQFEKIDQEEWDDLYENPAETVQESP